MIIIIISLAEKVSQQKVSQEKVSQEQVSQMQKEITGRY